MLTVFQKSTEKYMLIICFNQPLYFYNWWIKINTFQIHMKYTCAAITFKQAKVVHQIFTSIKKSYDKKY